MTSLEKLKTIWKKWHQGYMLQGSKWDLLEELWNNNYNMLGTSKKNKEQISEFTKVYGEILHGMHRDLTEFKSLVNNNDIAVKKLDDEINKKEKKNQIELEEHLNKIKKINKSLESSLSDFTKEKDDLLSKIEEISDAQKKSSSSIKNLFWFVFFMAILSLISVLLYLL